MQKKLFVTYFIVILLTLIGSLFAFWGRGYEFIKVQNDNAFMTRALILADELEQQPSLDSTSLDEFTKQKGEKFQLRITVIGMDGTVIADSQEKPGTMESHKNREEVLEAISDGQGSAMRYSKTLGVDYHYAAVKFKNASMEGVLRTSTPLSVYQELGYDIIESAILLLAIGIAFALLLAFIFTKKIMSPIKEITEAAERISAGDYASRIHTQENDHIGRLAKSFNKMSKNLSITMDIVTSRKTELETILSSMSSGVIAVDRSNNIMFFNQSFLSITEIGDTDIENEPLYNVIRNITIMDVVDLVKSSDERVGKEGTLTLSTEKNIMVIGVPLIREDKKVIGTLLVIEDVTKIKKLENMRREFVSNVTHELKTPLTSIRGFVDTLKNGAMSDPVYSKRFLDIIDIETDRLQNLIQDILVLSEIEAGQDDERSMCKVSTIIEDVTTLLEGKMKPNVSLVCKVEENIRDYFCNPFRLKEIFLNLMDNALKYTEEGNVELICKNENDYLCIQVKDSGIGIEKEHLSRLFERFYRVDKGRSRKQGGTGLGLSIVKHIVEVYGGTIEVSSVIGKGTTFYVKMPYS